MLMTFQYLENNIRRTEDMAAYGYNERMEYYLWGLFLGSDPKVISGTGNVSNKVVRVEIKNNRLVIYNKAAISGSSENGGES